MTIRLLSTYEGFPPNSIITLDSAVETALIAGGNATATLTGGVVAYQDRTPLMVQNGPKRSGTARINANRRVVVPLDEGMAMIITGDTGVVGTAQRYDATGAAVGSSTALTAGAMAAIGPYQGNQTVEIKVNAVGASALVQDGVLTVSGGGGGGVSSVSASPPLSVANPSTTPAISLPAATTAQAGHMTAAQVASLTTVAAAVLWRTSFVLPDAAPVVVALGGSATSVYRATVNPASGDSVLVETGTSGTGPWTAWPDGSVGVTDTGIFAPGTPAVTHMRFTRTAGAGTTSRCYVDEISK